MLFDIYKRGQGLAARLSTCAGLGFLALFGLWDLYRALEGWEATSFAGIQWRLVVVSLLAGAAAVAIAWFVNGQKPADFLIVTEAELRKVSWPLTRELRRQSLVVVVFTLLLGGIIFAADLIFVYLSRLLFVA